MRVDDIIAGAESAKYNLTLGDTSVLVVDDDNGHIHWTQPSNGFILFSRFGDYAAINAASSRKDEKRMLKKMGVSE